MKVAAKCGLQVISDVKLLLCCVLFFFNVIVLKVFHVFNLCIFQLYLCLTSNKMNFYLTSQPRFKDKKM